jgi:hypothetical protein
MRVLRELPVPVVNNRDCPTGTRLLASYLLALEQYQEIIVTSPSEWASETAEVLAELSAVGLRVAHENYINHISRHGCRPKDNAGRA